MKELIATWISLGWCGWAIWRCEAIMKRLKLRFFDWLLLFTAFSIIGLIGLLISFQSIEKYSERR